MIDSFSKPRPVFRHLVARADDPRCTPILGTYSTDVWEARRTAAYEFGGEAPDYVAARIGSESVLSRAEAAQRMHDLVFAPDFGSRRHRLR